jgi:hypothetical protein
MPLSLFTEGAGKSEGSWVNQWRLIKGSEQEGRLQTSVCGENVGWRRQGEQ